MSYFDDDANFARLLEEIQKWRGTPFMECTGRPAQGADCVRFVEGVLRNIGAIDPVPFPAYTVRGGGERMLEIFLATMDAIPKMECLWRGDGPRPPVKRGDVFLVSSGKALHHLAIVAVPPVLWHCLNAVGEGNIFDPTVEKHLRAIYRVKAHERQSSLSER